MSEENSAKPLSKKVLEEYQSVLEDIASHKSDGAIFLVKLSDKDGSKPGYALHEAMLFAHQMSRPEIYNSIFETLTKNETQKRILLASVADYQSPKVISALVYSRPKTLFETILRAISLAVGFVAITSNIFSHMSDSTTTMLLVGAVLLYLLSSEQI